MSGIIDYTVPTKVNPYAGDVKALAEAGDGKGFEILVPKDKSNTARLQFAKAANGINKTARLRVSEPVGENVRMVFTLTAKHKARKGDEATDTETAKDSLNAEHAQYADTDSMHTEPTEPAAPITPVKGKSVK